MSYKSKRTVSGAPRDRGTLVQKRRKVEVELEKEGVDLAAWDHFLRHKKDFLLKKSEDGVLNTKEKDTLFVLEEWIPGQEGLKGNEISYKKRCRHVEEDSKNMKQKVNLTDDREISYKKSCSNMSYKSKRTLSGAPRDGGTLVPKRRKVEVELEKEGVDLAVWNHFLRHKKDFLLKKSEDGVLNAKEKDTLFVLEEWILGQEGLKRNEMSYKKRCRLVEEDSKNMKQMVNLTDDREISYKKSCSNMSYKSKRTLSGAPRDGGTLVPKRHKVEVELEKEGVDLAVWDHFLQHKKDFLLKKREDGGLNAKEKDILFVLEERIPGKEVEAK